MEPSKSMRAMKYVQPADLEAASEEPLGSIRGASHSLRTAETPLRQHCNCVDTGTFQLDTVPTTLHRYVTPPAPQSAPACTCLLTPVVFRLPASTAMVQPANDGYEFSFYRLCLLHESGRVSTRLLPAFQLLPWSAHINIGTAQPLTSACLCFMLSC